ncbi:lipocalin-like domain-containing protein [Nonomuraea sp. PA05]|uniref:lipocalin-like domain-containing protein n=1 Tax=Nonomuraea sp. PA05 TaxID=2604466 RepID=UPI0011D4B119|nr:lipocalin-like domain-containing protein [Nonomuraea sp. PA05]TYB66663.1 lipocalin-like domain-containing protein [Nonomuraea sp. PA05]
MTIDDLNGAWTLRHVRISASGRPAVHLGEPETAGLLLYAGGHFSCVIRGATRLLGTGLIGYAGTAELDGDRLIHRVLIGAEPVPEGSVQVRHAVLDSATLTLSGQVKDHAVALTWRRAPAAAGPEPQDERHGRGLS